MTVLVNESWARSYYPERAAVYDVIRDYVVKHRGLPQCNCGQDITNVPYVEGCKGNDGLCSAALEKEHPTPF